MKREIELGYELDHLTGCLADWCIDFSDKQMSLPESLVEEMLQDDKIFVGIAYWGLDTEMRGRCLNWMSRKLTGMDWPINGDKPSVKEEHDRLWRSALLQLNDTNGQKN